MAANGVDTSVEPTAALYSTFVYLDSSERKRYSQSSHEYLVTCVQHTGAETVAPGASSKTHNIRLNMNHPVKNLAWVLKGSNFGQFTVGPRGTDNDRWAALASAKLQLNGYVSYYTSRRSTTLPHTLTHSLISPSALFTDMIALMSARGHISTRFNRGSISRLNQSRECTTTRLLSALPRSCNRAGLATFPVSITRPCP